MPPPWLTAAKIGQQQGSKVVPNAAASSSGQTQPQKKKNGQTQNSSNNNNVKNKNNNQGNKDQKGGDTRSFSGQSRASSTSSRRGGGGNRRFTWRWANYLKLLKQDDKRIFGFHNLENHYYTAYLSELCPEFTGPCFDLPTMKMLASSGEPNTAPSIPAHDDSEKDECQVLVVTPNLVAIQVARPSGQVDTAPLFDVMLQLWFLTTNSDGVPVWRHNVHEFSYSASCEPGEPLSYYLLMSDSNSHYVDSKSKDFRSFHIEVVADDKGNPTPEYSLRNFKTDTAFVDVAKQAAKDQRLAAFDKLAKNRETTA